MRRLLAACLLLSPLLALAAEEPAAAPPGKGMTAIVGGDVLTVGRGTVRGGTVLVGRDGRIAEVGARVKVPEGALVLSAAGRKVTPGLVAPLADNVGYSGPVGGPNRFRDVLDPWDLQGGLALSAGITTVFARAGPGSSSAVYKLGDGEPAARVLAEPAAVTLSYSGPAERYSVRENLGKARKYAAELAAFEAEKAAGREAKPPKKTASDDFVALVRRELPARIGANTADEILAALALVDEFGIRLVLEGAHESWIVADEIARRGVGVVLSPRSIPPRDAGRDGPSGGTIECARILEEKGVRFAVLPVGGYGAPGSRISLGGIGGRDLLFLTIEACFAIRGGASERITLAAITAAAADLLGVGGRIGTIEAGRDADLVIWSGDPFAPATQAEIVLVDGRVVYERAKSPLWK